MRLHSKTFFDVYWHSIVRLGIINLIQDVFIIRRSLKRVVWIILSVQKSISNVRFVCTQRGKKGPWDDYNFLTFTVSKYYCHFYSLPFNLHLVKVVQHLPSFVFFPPVSDLVSLSKVNESYGLRVQTFTVYVIYT